MKFCTYEIAYDAQTITLCGIDKERLATELGMVFATIARENVMYNSTLLRVVAASEQDIL